MASAGPAIGKGRKKSLDAEINLVPFIDLLSMCICFLLMTAVWMQLGTVNVKQAVGTDAPSDSAKQSELDLKYTSTSSLELSVKHAGSTKLYKVNAPTNEERLKQLRETVQGLAQTLAFNSQQDLKTQFGQNISAAHITTRTGVTYGELVSVMDVFRDIGVVNLGLVPVKE